MTDLSERIHAALAVDGPLPCIVDGARRWSRRTVDAVTARAATDLRSRGVRPNDIVEISDRDRPAAILAMIAVVRAGAAFCVVPEDYPGPRIEEIRARVSPVARFVGLTADGPDAELVLEAPHPTTALRLDDAPGAGDDDLAYVIFTSGSTGTPKVVEIARRGIAYIADQPHLYRGTVMGQLATLQFDACIYEVFGGLLNGMEIHIGHKEDLLDVDRLAATFEPLDSAFVTTQLLNLVVDRCPTALTGLQSLVFGGERASSDHVRRAFALVPRLIHAYGPTETTVYATTHLVTADDGATVPIGVPLGGARFVIDPVDDAGGPGVGELVIGGAGVMRRYRGDEDSTRASITALADGPGYRTGDLVTLDARGDLVFVGRRDRQVKVAGYRVDPAEVERAAVGRRGVRSAVAMADGTRLRLVVTGCDDLRGLRDDLRAQLPAYSVPVVSVVDEIPLTRNGKTDQEALLALVRGPSPRQVETRRTFLEVLRIDDFSGSETFLDLGGDSIQAMEAIWRLDAAGVEIDLGVLFSDPLQAVVDRV
jgi:non-ribosomal peptide synthetase component F/aryl carrier-like protein